jgi:A/G-specific adenine glycosylase
MSKAEAQEFNLGILDFAAELCAPKTPNCEECFFTEQCHYYQSLA